MDVTATFLASNSVLGTLFFHWEQLIYSVVEKKKNLILDYYLVDIANIKILNCNLFSKTT